MLHPAVAHFAMSLPIIALVLGIAYLIKPSELMSKISTRFMVIATLFIVAAFFSGKADGGEVYIFLSSEGQEVLRNHKDLGLYLVILMVITTLVKMVGCKIRNKKIEIIGIVLIAIMSVGVLAQGKMGGELTYTYGAHVQNHSDGLDCIEEALEMEDDD